MCVLFIYINNKTQIFSAWSPIRTDLKYGNSHDFGNFNGCKVINPNMISTQYCMFQYFKKFDHPIPVPPQISYDQDFWIDLDVSFLSAICVPSSCTIENIRKVLNMIVEGQNITINSEIYCRSNLNQKTRKYFRNFDFWILDWINFERIL